MTYAIKTEIRDPQTDKFTFDMVKTMYGGKYIISGDTIFIFASETQGGRGLLARGEVVKANPVPKEQIGARETPRVSISVAHLTRAKGQLGRDQLKSFANWTDGQPATELNFKFYRQATNKIVRISDRTAAFLEEFF